MTSSRPMASVALALFVAACGRTTPPAATSSQPAAPQAAPSPSPASAAAVPSSFTKFDELAAVTALCEAVAPGSSVSTLTGQPQKVEGYLNREKDTLYEVLLSADFVGRTGPRHVLVVGAHYIEDGEIRSAQAQSTEVAAVVLEPRPGRWAAVASAKKLAEGGQYGGSPSATLLQIGTARFAVRLGQGTWLQGNELASEEWFEPVGETFARILDVNTSATVSPDNDKNASGWKGSLEVIPQAGADAFDVRLTVSGTYRTEAGKQVRLVGPVTLRLQGGAYKPVDASPAAAAQWKALTSVPW